LNVEKRSVAVIPGDGVGTEVVPIAVEVLRCAAEIDGGLSFEFTEFPWSSRYYLDHGVMMPADAITTLGAFSDIVLGAVGWPTVPDHVSLWGLLLPIRRGFQLYANLRPTRLLRGAPTPLAGKQPGSVDFTILRENTEGEYSNIGGRLHRDLPNEVVVQTTIFTAVGTERIIRYGFELATRSRRVLVGATKSNGINYVMPYWDEVFQRIGTEYPDVQSSLMHADALAAKIVLEPETFDVIVASNLLGDILSEVGAAIQGGIGMAASANLNPEGGVPNMYEPVHGSAPDIAGRGIANPVGQIWSVKLMLDQLGRRELGALLLEAIEDVVAQGPITPDLGGKATTAMMGQAIIARFRAVATGPHGRAGLTRSGTTGRSSDG
jgi:tartrate dehydrogenase/decarboxylase / D-malate dehydrogenase